MSANHDPDEFSRPEEVRLDRQPDRHFSFGVGVHRRPGASLARTALRVPLDETLPRLGDFRLAAPPTRYSATRGISSLPITFPSGKPLSDST